MGRLLASFFYRLRRDLTFKITFFIGLGLAIGLPLLYFGVDLGIYLIAKMESPESAEFTHMLCTGQNLFVGSFSPTQNFGIAIPINLISFIVLEFNHGTVRNKIISGHSKLSVFLSIAISSAILSLGWIIMYVGISTGLGSLISLIGKGGGFDPSGLAGLTGNVTPNYLIKLAIIALLCYVTIACMAAFFATLFRNIGPTIAVVLLLILGAYFSAMLVGSAASLLPDVDAIKYIVITFKVLDPLYGVAVSGASLLSNEPYSIDTLTFVSGIINNLVYSSLFVIFGAVIFTHSDVK